MRTDSAWHSTFPLLPQVRSEVKRVPPPTVRTERRLPTVNGDTGLLWNPHRPAARRAPPLSNACLGRRPGQHRPDPYQPCKHLRHHRNQEALVYSLLAEMVDKGIVTRDEIEAEMSANHVRHDSLEVMERYRGWNGLEAA